jgi:hypothetical protein
MAKRNGDVLRARRMYDQTVIAVTSMTRETVAAIGANKYNAQLHYTLK